MRDWDFGTGVARNERDVGPSERRNAGDAIYALRIVQSRAALARLKAVCGFTTKLSRNEKMQMIVK
jgi:hypothetical protein